MLHGIKISRATGFAISTSRPLEEMVTSILWHPPLHIPTAVSISRHVNNHQGVNTKAVPAVACPRYFHGHVGLGSEITAVTNSIATQVSPDMVTQPSSTIRVAVPAVAGPAVIAPVFGRNTGWVVEGVGTMVMGGERSRVEGGSWLEHSIVWLFHASTRCSRALGA